MSTRLPTNAEAAAILIRKIGTTNLAKSIGVKRQAVDDWKKRGVPLVHVGKVSKITGASPAEIIPEIARHISTVSGRDCSAYLGELIKAFY